MELAFSRQLAAQGQARLQVEASVNRLGFGAGSGSRADDCTTGLEVRVLVVLLPEKADD